MPEIPFLSIEQLYKVYENNVTANRDVFFTADRGEIHGLIGENGSGKSTLMNIIAGEIKPDSGRILICGRECVFESPRDALSQGIGLVHQHPRLIPQLTIMENIILGNEPVAFPWRIDRKASAERINTIAERFDLDIDPYRKSIGLTLSQEQKVSILNLLYNDVTVMLLDESTTALTGDEVDRLFSVLRRLTEDGKLIILVSHKLREILSIADKISIMRDGEIVETRDKYSTTYTDLQSYFPELNDTRTPAKTAKSEGPPLLSVEGLEVDSHGILSISDINFDLHAGEILSITGVRENGIETIEAALTGQAPYTGRLTIRGVEYKRIKPEILRKLGIGYIPSKRIRMGASMQASVSDNLIILMRRAVFPHGIMRKKEIKRIAADIKDNFAIQGRVEEPMLRLSGGNIQKVILGRELYMRPDIIIYSEPCWGLDDRSRSMIYATLRNMKAKGTAILVLSTDFDVILTLSDRIGIMYNRQLKQTYYNKGLTRKQLGRYVMGGVS